VRLNNTAFFAACAAAAVASATVAMLSPACTATQRQAFVCQLDALEQLPHDPEEITVGELRDAIYRLRACRVVEVPPDAGAP
jgi:hypothetical protein